MQGAEKAQFFGAYARCSFAAPPRRGLTLREGERSLPTASAARTPPRETTHSL
jgi:hypothetical protein